MRLDHRIYTTMLLGVSGTLALAGCGGEPTVIPTPAMLTATVSPPSGGPVGSPASKPAPTTTTVPTTATTVLPTLAALAPPTLVPPKPPVAPSTLAPATPTVLPLEAGPTLEQNPPTSIPATPPALPTEAALAPEQNPPGDIADSQVFVPYQAADGSYQVEVPEGWARTVDRTTVTFQDKLDGIAVTQAAADQAPTTASVRIAQVPALQAGGRAVQITAVRTVTLSGGAAIVIEYQSNSEPNAVTGKQIRRENAAYLFFRGGRLATLQLWAPAGADNVDQWQRMAQSFRWR